MKLRMKKIIGDPCYVDVDESVHNTAATWRDGIIAEFGFNRIEI
jgi:hypothetical protein